MYPSHTQSVRDPILPEPPRAPSPQTFFFPVFLFRIIVGCYGYFRVGRCEARGAGVANGTSSSPDDGSSDRFLHIVRIAAWCMCYRRRIPSPERGVGGEPWSYDHRCTRHLPLRKKASEVDIFQSHQNYGTL